MKPRLICVVGPTASGKTALALDLAEDIGGEIVSADSRQLYRGLDIGTAKPTAAECARVPHHCLDLVDPGEPFDAGRFRSAATDAIGAITARGRVPLVVGGTGLYVRALLRGLDPAVPADPAFRAELTQLAARHGRPVLHARLAAQAPTLARRLHPNDHVRVIRALELVRAGSPTGEARTRWRDAETEQGTVYIGLTLDRSRLDERLRQRAARMAAAGLEAEVRGLLARGYAPTLPAMQGIGYREFSRVAAGELDAEEALRLMQRETLRYARRQWTWFAREPALSWIDTDASDGGAAGIAAMIEAKLEQEDGIG